MFFQLKENIFQKASSGSQHGTTQWSLNVTNMTNAKKGPKDAFNAYKDFSDVELDAQIVAATMVHFNMETIDGMKLNVLLRVCNL